ncbi:MAG: twin transmembrane helix small protein [Rhodospirillaceae bacterium]
MESVFTVLLGLALVAVLVVLATGLVAFIAGGEFNRKYANKLMRLRVATQAVAVLLLLILLLLRTLGNSGG